jgi:hypothetical protein
MSDSHPLTVRRLLSAVVAWLVLAGGLHGQDRFPLLIEVEQSSNVSRSGGPVPVSLYVQWGGRQGFVNGDLTLEIRDDFELLAVHVLPDLYISAGEQRIEFLLPPPSSSVRESQYDVFPTFVTAEGRHELNEQQLRLPGAGRRTTVITVGTTSTGFEQPRETRFEPAFHLERLSPHRTSNRSDAVVMTLARTVPVREFPTQPLWHCVSDLVLLTGASFAELSDRQGQSLLAWVRAGGSFCLLLDETPLTGPQIDLLNEFLSASPEEPLVYRGPNGGPILTDRESDSIPAPVLAECGFGRVVVSDHPPEVPDGRTGLSVFRGDRDGPDPWMKAVAFLWKLRNDQSGHLNRNGTWSVEIGERIESTSQERAFSPQLETPYRRQDVWKFRPQSITGGMGLLEQTLPRGMQVVPLWLMGATLLLYVLAIGPADYLTLGMLRGRKYTWILFPCFTVLFTGGAIWVSNMMMQGRDHGGSIHLMDVTPQGHLARETEIGLLFFASSTSARTELVQKLFTPLDHRRLGARALHRLDDREMSESRSTPMIVSGMLPHHGEALQSVPQWTPQLNRTLRIPAEPVAEPSGFDWSVPIDPFTPEGLDTLRNRLVAAFGAEIHAQLFSRGLPTFPRPNIIFGEEKILASKHESRAVFLGQLDYVDFVRSSAWKEDPGLFSVVSRVAPKCDDFLEDLPLLDPSDRSTCLLIVARQEENNWQIFRRLYHVER